jgi:hypothetical protein
MLAGAISGMLATLPAVALLYAFGSIQVEAQIIGRSEIMTLAGGALVMAVAGAFYGRIFGRAANDRRGGWLFGLVFGFALWAAGAVMLLPLISSGRTPAGQPAIGVFLSLVTWGAALGLVHPFVHHPLHERPETAAKRMGPHVGTPQSDRWPA